MPSKADIPEGGGILLIHRLLFNSALALQFVIVPKYFEGPIVRLIAWEDPSNYNLRSNQIVQLCSFDTSLLFYKKLTMQGQQSLGTL